LNEFDRFVKHDLRSKTYLRYGDDFIIIESSLNKLKSSKRVAIDFLERNLKLQLNPQNNKIIKTRNGLKFLGVLLWPDGRSLTKRNLQRVTDRLNLHNAPSYYGLIWKHEGIRKRKLFDWILSEQLI